jgi:hypothetical protein
VPSDLTPQDYENAETIFTGWRQRIQIAEAQATDYRDTLGKIAEGNLTARSASNMAWRALQFRG